MRVEGRLDEVLSDLVAAWRVHRAARLADLVDVVGAKVDGEVTPLVASKRAADLAAWTTRERARDPRDFGALMAAARGGGQDDVVAHVRALAAWDDPRLSRGLLALLADPPYAGVRSRGMLKVVLEALESTHDVRVVPLARELAGRYPSIVQSGTGGWVATELEALAARMSTLSPPSIPDELARACAALEERLGPTALEGRHDEDRRTKTREALQHLEAMVHEAPDDDDRRLVFADALLEAGDPRGELVVLQLARARGTADAEQRAREQALRFDSSALASWAQPLSNAGACTFERGFPVAVSLFAKPARDVLASPAWATVRRLQGLDRWPKAVVLETLSRPGFAHVRDLGTISAAMLSAIAAARVWPFRAVHVSDAEALEAGALASFPSLESLYLRARGAFPPGSFRAPKLVELTVEGPTLDPESVPSGLRRLVVRVPGVPPVPLLSRQSALRALGLYVGSTTELEAALATLPALDELELSAERLSPGAFARAPSLRRLCLSLNALRSVSSRELSGLSALRALDLAFGASEHGALRSMTALESLRHVALSDVDDVPESPRLRELHMTAPAPEELARLLARLPALEELHLDHRHGTEVSAGGIAAAVRESSVRVLRFRRGAFELTAVRVTDGWVLKFALGPDLAIEIGRALGRVTTAFATHGTASVLRSVESSLGVKVRMVR